MKRLLLGVLLVSTLSTAKDFTNSIGMKFKEIPSGSFMMGRDAAFEDGGGDELPLHKVKIKSFYLASTEVTQSQWVKVMGGNNPSNFKARNNPVEKVSWNDAKKFIQKLNQKEGINKYRLPTEPEWEYCARAGNESKWSFGDEEGNLGNNAWYIGNSGDKTHPVAQKKPNKFGLYDMYGNVWEWTSSCYTKTYDKGCYDNFKALRGGSWGDGANFTRSASRNDTSPGVRVSHFGFRLARTK